MIGIVISVANDLLSTSCRFLQFSHVLIETSMLLTMFVSQDGFFLTNDVGRFFVIRTCHSVAMLRYDRGGFTSRRFLTLTVSRGVR